MSCSFMARAASSMSLKVFTRGGGVWPITASSSASTLRTALQHGQVTSKAELFFAIEGMILQNIVAVRYSLHSGPWASIS